jgi:RNA polymerase sigma-70 factor (ECF subfamily)
MLLQLAMIASDGVADAGDLEDLERTRTVSSGARFDDVYRQHAPFVWRVLRGMGIGEAVVEDAVQDVFVVVHRRLPEWDGRHAIKTWLFEIAYRVACEHRRKVKRSRSHQELPDELEDSAPGPASSAEQHQDLQLLARALDRLSEEQRAVLVLTEIEGMTAPEISTATGVSLNTVYTRLRRARIAVDEALSALRGKGRR